LETFEAPSTGPHFDQSGASSGTAMVADRHLSKRPRTPVPTSRSTTRPLVGPPGVSAKNAILIVEFAKAELENGARKPAWLRGDSV
jgi:hypothetical protein